MPRIEHRSDAEKQFRRVVVHHARQQTRPEQQVQFIPEIPRFASPVIEEHAVTSLDARGAMPSSQCPIQAADSSDASVIPAKAETQRWVPAFAAMTGLSTRDMIGGTVLRWDADGNFHAPRVGARALRKDYPRNELSGRPTQ